LIAYGLLESCINKWLIPIYWEAGWRICDGNLTPLTGIYTSRRLQIQACIKMKVGLCLLQENPLGVWEFRSKSSQNSCSLAGGCRGYMFALQVTEELDQWPGQASYNRKWVSVSRELVMEIWELTMIPHLYVLFFFKFRLLQLTVNEAFECCRYDWMRDALKHFLLLFWETRTLAEREDLGETRMIPVSDNGVESATLWDWDHKKCRFHLYRFHISFRRNE
jgi:hypothetical protein